MKENWIEWNFNKIEKEKNKTLLGKNLKFSLTLFFLTFILLINLKVIEVLSLADGKIIPQGRRNR